MTTARTPRAPRARCAAHPARPAVDSCPFCGRPRCGADASAVPGGCLACGGPPTNEVPRVRPAPDLERLVRAALAAYAVAVLGGVVVSEYVGATVFAYLGPAVVGVVCGGAATRAAGTERQRGRLATRARVLAGVLAVLGVGLGFLLEGSRDPLSVRSDVLLAYVAAVAGAVLWTMPPRSRPAAEPGHEPGQERATGV